MQTIDLSKMTVGELKALAYDYIAQKERIERDLANINQAIANRQQAMQKQAETATAEKEAEVVKKKEVNAKK
jgi:hypothetical protein